MGTDSSTCGRPCESHTVSLRDRMGYEHTLKADFACRNTVFNAVAQSGVEYLASMREAGIFRFRIDLLSEDKAQAVKTIQMYRRVIRGEVEPKALWRELHSNSKLGVTRGSLDHYEGGLDRLYSIAPQRKPAHAKS